MMEKKVGSLNTKVMQDAVLLVEEIRKELANGTKHYRISDSKLLLTDKEIIETLIKEGRIEFLPIDKMIKNDSDDGVSKR